MDAFEYNKHNEAEYFKSVLSNYIIVSYGFITSIDSDTVVVTLAVSDKGSAERVTCTFMNLGDDQFSLRRKPVVNMRVLVLAPNKVAEGMYESYDQLNLEQGRNFVLTRNPSIYSSQNAICVPIMKSTAQSLSSVIIDSVSLTAEIKHQLLISVYGALELDIYEDTNIEYHEDTNHFRGFYGNLEKTFGILEGAEGKEKEGTFNYEESYGKYSIVKKNYESGLTTVIGKSYPTPFLADKGELEDTDAPVLIDIGNNSPVTINIGEGSSISLAIGETKINISVDTTNGIDISLKDAAKVNIVTETGKFKFKNDNGSLKELFDKIADLCAGITTIGGNVVPAVPYAAGVDPATAAKFSVELKNMIADILE